MSSFTRTYTKYIRKISLFPLEPCQPDFSEKKLAIIIPVQNEEKLLPETLYSLAQQPIKYLEKTIVLLCINDKPDNSFDSKENQQILRRLRQADSSLTSTLIPGKHLFWIDATHNGNLLPQPGGVGHARKLGFDTLICGFGPQNTDLPLVSLDADTTVAPNYLEALLNLSHNTSDYSGFVIPFRHRCIEPELQPFIDHYDAYLDSYVNGLRYAKSPYAYHTLGSAMGTTLANYIKINGMKTQSGGEDFYFLQALRKIGSILELPTHVFPAARLSDRVPFGTGPRLKELAEGQTLTLYELKHFEELKLILSIVNECVVSNRSSLPHLFEIHLSPKANLFFQQRNFPEVWKKIITNTPKTDAHTHQAFHAWFDAFKTLKFIHFICDYHQMNNDNLN